jgi:acetyltransferase-like isoleucine patch superfamily enzyme
MILPGSQIGDDSIVEAGAVVRGAIPPRSYVAGNPATVVSDAAAIDERSGPDVAGGPDWPYDGSNGDRADAEQHGRALLDRAGSSPGLGRPTRRIIDRLRGEHTLEQLVAEGLQLGERVSVARRAYLDPGRPWLIELGDDCVISDFAIILAHEPGPRKLAAGRLGSVVVGRRVFVAPGAILLPGSRIGDDSIIDVRAVVSGEIPPGSFVSGNPGCVVGDVEAMADQCRRAAAGGPPEGSGGYIRGSKARG